MFKNIFFVDLTVFTFLLQRPCYLVILDEFKLDFGMWIPYDKL